MSPSPRDSPRAPPLLFLSFINDLPWLPTGITSKLPLSAYDCLIYRTISNSADSEALQEHLNKLQKWSDIWQVKFNTEKCHTKQIILYYNPTNADYHLGGCTLSMVTQYPYLGAGLYAEPNYCQSYMFWWTHGW